MERKSLVFAVSAVNDHSFWVVFDGRGWPVCLSKKNGGINLECGEGATGTGFNTEEDALAVCNFLNSKGTLSGCYVVKFTPERIG